MTDQIATQPRRTEAQLRLEKILDGAAQTIIMFASPEVPQMGNWTLQQLIDEAAQMGEAKRRSEAIEKTLKEIIKTRKEELTRVDAKTLAGRGEKFSMTSTTSDVTRLDQSKAKEKLLELGGQAALDECMPTVEQETLRFKEL